MGINCCAGMLGNLVVLIVLYNVLIAVMLLLSTVLTNCKCVLRSVRVSVIKDKYTYKYIMRSLLNEVKL